MIALGACALGAAGIGWAATRAADAGAITACVEPASNALFYSTNGTCPGGQTTVVWNETGPQGAPGAPGPQGLPGASATQGVTFGPSKYTNGFTISGTVTARGNYAFEGTVEREQATTVHPGRNFQVICSLLSGPPNGSATQLTSTTQTFVYNRKTKTYEPNGYDGPTGLDVAQFVQANQVPLVETDRSLRSGVLHPPSVGARDRSVAASPCRASATRAARRRSRAAEQGGRRRLSWFLPK